jgi:hypothetical protein
MKAIPVRNAAALALLLALGACGGKASFELAGNLVDSLGVPKPLGGSGLVLANGDQRLSVPVGATTFKFPNTISYGTEYAMTVSQQPRHMTCNFAGGAVGTAGRTATISATLICNQNAYPIGGVVNGLGSGTLVLVNGTDQLSVTTANLNFTMPATVPDRVDAAGRPELHGCQWHRRDGRSPTQQYRGHLRQYLIRYSGGEWLIWPK